MLLFVKRTDIKAPAVVKRSRAGCIHCKSRKKKCSEARPRCERCIERDLECTYDAVRPRRLPAPKVVDSTTPPTAKVADLKPYDILERLSYYENKGRTSNHISDETALIHTPAPHRNVEYMLPHPFLHFNLPVFKEFSEDDHRRALIHHFCSVLSHVVVFQEDAGNPFRQLVLPLAVADSPLLDAIYALSCAHLEHRRGKNEDFGLSFHTKALTGVSALIASNDDARRSELLATIMLLVYYEVLAGCDNANIVKGHIHGAMTIMSTYADRTTPVGDFLRSAFSFFDVITALSHSSTPVSALAGFSTSPTCQIAPENTARSPSQLYSVHTLLGMATDLWPVMHHLSDLVARREEIQDLELVFPLIHANLEAESICVETSLQNWRPPVEAGEDSIWEISHAITSTVPCTDEVPTKHSIRIRSIICNAEAYRYAALVHLYRHVNLIPRASLQVQTYVKMALTACFYVVIHEGPMSALLWPLFIAASEALDEQDRTTARVVFQKVALKQGMVNIEKAGAIVEEVWRRMDSGERNVSWPEVCRERGITIVLG